MRKREDFTRLIAVALALSAGILVAFQLYILREPGRIENVLAADKAEQVALGQKLFQDNCTSCHGDNGEGDTGPALNDRKFLTSTENGRIFSIISSGIPATGMPSWSQLYGGPFTDEQITDLVGFIRNWEATAKDVVKAKPTPDPAVGQDIFTSICYACHGDHGQGTSRAPALNSKELLTKFDDSWFRQTIADGRPAQGMPTWGKVLSPEQIDAVVAFIRSWEPTAPELETPAATQTSGPIAVNPTAAPTLAPTAEATATATTAAPAPTAAPAAGPVPNCGKPNCAQPGPAIAQNLTGNVASGTTLYAGNCKRCHGDQGKGGVNNPGSADGTVPPLNPIDPAFKSGDFKLNIDLFVEHGSTPEGPAPALSMLAFGDKGLLKPQQIADLIAYIASLNP